jgi:hypothetical protein
MVKLGDVAKVQNGFAFKSDDFVKDGIQLIKMGNIKKDFFDVQNNPSYLPSSFQEKYSAFMLNEGNILISMTGTVGKDDYANVCQINRNKKFLLNQRVGRFKIFNSDSLHSPDPYRNLFPERSAPCLLNKAPPFAYSNCIAYAAPHVRGHLLYNIEKNYLSFSFVTHPCYDRKTLL